MVAVLDLLIFLAGPEVHAAGEEVGAEDAVVSWEKACGEPIRGKSLAVTEIS